MDNIMVYNKKVIYNNPLSSYPNNEDEGKQIEIEIYNKKE